MYFNYRQGSKNREYTRSLVKLPIFLLVGSLGVYSCIPKYDDDASFGGGSGNGKASRFTSINFKPIPSDMFVTKDGKKPVTHLHLKVSSSGDSCQQINELKALDNQLSIAKKVTRGCEYRLTLELGQADSTDPSSPNLKEVFYDTSTPFVFNADKDSVPITVNLSLTTAGKNIGLPETLENNGNSNNNGGTDNLGGNNNSNNNTDPNLTDLPDQLKVSLKSENGTKNLSELFTSKYMVLDFSRLGCPPCISMAKSFENGGSRSSFTKLTSGKSCKFITLIPPGQVEEWNIVVGGRGESNAKSHSYEYAGGHAGFAKLINYKQSIPTPTFVIIDRTGKVIAEAEGDIPREVNSLCKE